MYISITSHKNFILLIYLNMNYRLYGLFLALVKRVAIITQIGNRHGRAPELIESPDKNQLIYVDPLSNISLWQLKNVICSGFYGGAVIDKFNRVYGRFIVHPWGKELHPIISSPYLGSKIRKIDKATFLFTRSAKGNYYHWITDMLPSLLIIFFNNKAILNDRMIILHEPGRTYESDTFNLLGIKTEIVRIKSFQILDVNDLIIPDFHQSYDGNLFPAWKMHLLQRFKDVVLSKNDSDSLRKRIYLVRGNQKTRRLIGEDLLISSLEQLEFSIIDPQSLSLLDQIRVLSNAELVVALHGAALTNIIFCKEKTIVIELRSKHLPPEYFSEIAQVFNLKFNYFSLSPVKTKALRHLANEQNLIIDREGINSVINLITSYTDENLNLIHNR